ncbi:MAG: choice-of-anchor J domain-containing protein [candidate division WOR-3 bacterium]
MIFAMYLAIVLNLPRTLTTQPSMALREKTQNNIIRISEYQLNSGVQLKEIEEKQITKPTYIGNYTNLQGEKADRDTFKYDDGTFEAYYGDPTYKYFYAFFPVSRHRPGYSPADSTFILTSVRFMVYYPRANAVCSVLVYDKYGTRKRTTSYSFPSDIDGAQWYEVPVNPTNLYDTFLVMVYLPTTRIGNLYYNTACLDNSNPTGGLTGVYYNNQFYYWSNYDVMIQAIGHFEQIHDVSAWEMVFPTLPYRVAEPESLVWRVYNFGNYDESSVPVTVILGNNEYNLNLNSIPRKDYTEIITPQRFTVSGEGLIRTTFWTSLTNDYDRTNDTFPDFYIYFFPKYTPYAEDFDFISSLSNAGWTVVNNDGGTQQWSLAFHKSFSNSGWQFVASRYESSTLRNDDWLISPAIGIYDTCATAIGFYARAISSNYPESLEVWVMSGTSPGDTIEALYRGRLTNTYKRFTYSLDKYRGQEVRIGFRNRGLDQYYIFLDDYYVRQLPLPPGCTMMEEFEEILTPPGWAIEGDLWRGGSPQDAGVSDAGTGNVFYFLSNSTPGSSSTLYSPIFKANLPNNRVSYRFLYHNTSGNDSLQVWMRVADQSWQYINTYFTTDGWDTIIGGPIIVEGKENYILQFRFIGYADGGNSNMAIDNIEIYSDVITENPENLLTPSFTVKTHGKSLAIELQGLKSGVQLALYDAQGRALFSKKLEKDALVITPQLKAGVYFVVIDGDLKVYRKIIHLR